MKKLTVFLILTAISMATPQPSYTALASQRLASTFTKGLLKEILALRLGLHSQFRGYLYISPADQQDMIDYYTSIYPANLSGKPYQLVGLRQMMSDHLTPNLQRNLQSDASFIEFISRHSALVTSIDAFARDLAFARDFLAAEYFHVFIHELTSDSTMDTRTKISRIRSHTGVDDDERIEHLIEIHELQRSYDILTEDAFPISGTMENVYAILYQHERDIFSLAAQQKLDMLLPEGAGSPEYSLEEAIVEQVSAENYTEARRLVEDLDQQGKERILSKLLLLAAHIGSEENIDDTVRRRMDFMIEAGADPTTVLITIAGITDNHDMHQHAKVLIELGADIDLAMVHFAHHKIHEGVEFLLELGANLHRTLYILLSRENLDPVFFAAAEFLINEFDVNPNYTLALALNLNLPNTMRERLIHLGADVDVDPTDILLAINENLPNTMRALLIDAAAAPPAADLIGSTADSSTIRSSAELPQASTEVANMLIRAVNQGDVDTITRIMQAEALPVDLVIDEIGTTLLQHAASEGVLAVVKHLIEVLGADPNIMNKLQVTVLDTAIFFRNGEVAQFLRTRGAVSAQHDSDTGVRAAPTIGN